MGRTRRPDEGRIVGGCPCGLWAVHNCAYTRTQGLCRTRLDERPALPVPHDEGRAVFDAKYRRCEEHNRARYWCGCYYREIAERAASR
jgi:hypothetical protein